MSTAMIEVSDEVLARRARAGDGAAFADFARRWWPIIGRFAWSMLGNASQAAAVTEEVVRSVLQATPPPDVPVPRFMYRLAMWLAIVRRRTNASTVATGSPVLQALDRLPRMERAAFLLRDVEELPLAEAAAILESSPAIVQAHVHRSRVLLARILGELASAIDLEFGFPVRRTA